MQSLAMLTALVRPYLPIVLGVTIVLVLVLVIISVIAFKRLRKPSPSNLSLPATPPAPAKKEKAEPEEEAPPIIDQPHTALPDKTLNDRIRAKLSELGQTVGLRKLQSIPWCLALSNQETQFDKLFSFAGSIKFGDKALSWFNFQQGIILTPGGKVGALGDARNQSGFTLFLKTLLRFKPHRPLDGILITLSIQELLVASNPEALGEAISRQLTQVQTITGMRPPIYIVITDCEYIEGFTDICATLSQDQLKQLFGWSSPYAPDTVWSPEWVKEAEHYMLGSLESLRSTIFSKPIPADTAARIFRFQSHLKRLFKPLGEFSNELFSHNVYHEPFQFRGIWFCGAPLTAKEKDVAFIRDLVEEKIFPEHGIAVPVRRVLSARTNSVRLAQACMVLFLVVWSIGIWAGHKGLERQVPTVIPVIQSFEKMRNAPSIKLWRMTHTSNITPSTYSNITEDIPRVQKVFEENARTLLLSLSDARQDWMTSPFFPTSYLTNTEGRAMKFYRKAFNDIILKGITFGLLHKGRIIFAPPQPVGKEIPGAPDSLLPEFISVKEYVNSAAKFVDIVTTYNDLNATSSITDLRNILNYVFNIHLEDELDTTTSPLGSVLGNSEYRDIDLQMYSTAATEAFDIRMAQLSSRIFDRNSLEIYVDQLSAALVALDQSAGGELTEHAERNVRSTINRIQDTLENPVHSWAATTYKQPIPDLPGILSKSASIVPIDETTIANWIILLKEQRMALFERLRNKNSTVVGDLMVLNDDVLELSPVIVKLSDSIKRLHEQRFMRDAAPTPIAPEIPMATEVRWDIPALQQAVQMVQPYEEYIKTYLKEFPSSLQGEIQAHASNKLAANIAESVATAQRFVTSPRLMSQDNINAELSGISNFSSASPLLLRIMAIYEQLGRSEKRARLVSFVDSQALSLLRASSDHLDASQLYQPDYNSINQWRGDRPTNVAVFGLLSKDEVEPFLTSQRERLEFLVTSQVAPVMAYIYRRTDFSSYDRSTVTLWESMISELNYYAERKPGNSLNALDNYILNLLNQPGPPEPPGGKSWFAARASDIFDAVNSRQSWLELQAFSNQWKEAEKFFANNLQGRYPFAPITSLTENNATPAAVRAFIKLLPTAPQHVSMPAGVTDFMKSMQAIHQFISITNQNTKGPVPALAYDIEFRSLRDFEKNNNQLLDQIFTVGTTINSYRNGNANGVWTYGDTANLTLQWAENGDRIPVFIGQNANVIFEGMDVTFAYDTPWGLIAFIQQHAFDPASYMDGIRIPPGTLAFEVQTNRKGATGDGEVTERMPMQDTTDGVVRTFMHVTLRKPGKPGKPPGERVLLPSRFPKTMPSFDPYTVWQSSKKS
ncbi:MAG: type VI secretion system protein [Desulfovibrionales bacterium]|nr:type VI secretion system protein [Desulfovibrionales bacterium]